MHRIILLSAVCLAVPYFSTLFHKRLDFRKKKVIQNNISILILSITFVSNITHFKKNSAAYHKCTLVFMQSARCFCYILLKFKFSQHIFETRSNIKYHENLTSGHRVVPSGQTDGQMSLFAILRTRVTEQVYSGPFRPTFNLLL
jgi:hypothetical protein